MKFTIFYSWQKDLPGKVNRNFIEECLESAVKSINQQVSILCSIDRDTRFVSGAPDIENEVLSKIDSSIAFIGDVSIINNDNKSAEVKTRLTPNPNVLIELGYAIKSKGLSNILMVQNTNYGSPEDLPFDLRGKRIIGYNLNPESSSKASVRNLLTKRFENELKVIVDSSSKKASIDISIVIFYNEECYPFSMPSPPQLSIEVIFKMAMSLFNAMPQKPKLPTCFSEYSILDIENERWIKGDAPIGKIETHKLSFVHKSSRQLDPDANEETNTRLFCMLFGLYYQKK